MLRRTPRQAHPEQWRPSPPHRGDVYQLSWCAPRSSRLNPRPMPGAELELLNDPRGENRGQSTHGPGDKVGQKDRHRTNALDEARLCG
jgi:hypothetical protein